MDGLESTLNQILGDPESMAQIMSLAQSSDCHRHSRRKLPHRRRRMTFCFP